MKVIVRVCEGCEKKSNLFQTDKGFRCICCGYYHVQKPKVVRPSPYKTRRKGLNQELLIIFRERKGKKGEPALSVDGLKVYYRRERLEDSRVYKDPFRVLKP